MTPDRKRAIVGRLLIYLAIIPLAWLALVPHSFETLQLFASGKLWPQDTQHAPATSHATRLTVASGIDPPPTTSDSPVQAPSSAEVDSTAPNRQR